MKNALPLCALLLASSQASAFFCPGNFQQIQLGDTLDSVLQKCGQPASREEIAAPDTGPQEWIYNIMVAGQGSLRMSVMLKDDKILNIVANSMSLPSTDICGKAVSVGDTADTLKATCGDPMMVNKGTVTDSSKPQPLVVLHYSTNPPETLTFDHGKLAKREQGV